MKTTILRATDEAITQAATLLQSGDIVAFPTETVYGLGALVGDPTAIKKIYTAKGRPGDNPLIAHISYLSQASSLASSLPASFDTLAHAFFPGPLTLVVEKNDAVPGIASANLSTIGIRMPNHPVALQLIQKAGSPIMAPSANVSGKPSPTDAQHVFDDLTGKIPLILDAGPCDVGIESTVVDLSTTPPVVLRPGSVTKEQLEVALGAPVVFATSATPITSPGMKYRHYAPDAHIHVSHTMRDALNQLAHLVPSTTLILTNISHFPKMKEAITLPLNQRTLYAHFRQADKNRFSDILIVLDDTIQKNTGLMNRIMKANSKQ